MSRIFYLFFSRGKLQGAQCFERMVMAYRYHALLLAGLFRHLALFEFCNGSQKREEVHVQEPVNASEVPAGYAGLYEALDMRSCSLA